MTFDDDMQAVRDRAGIRRFRIKRLKLDVSSDWPWQLHDRERPYVFGHARTHRAAVLLVDAIRGGHTTVLDEDDEVIAYRPGPADEQPGDTFAEGWRRLASDLLAFFRPERRRRDYALVPPALPHINAPCSVLPILEPTPVQPAARAHDTALGAALLPDCDCGSVDKYGDDIGEHSPRCPYHLAVLRLAPLVDRQTLDRVCKASLERMARRA